MPAVSQREYLRRSTGQDTADEQAEQMTGHLQDGPDLPAPPPGPLVRPFAARRYGTRHLHHHAAAAADRPDRSEEGHQARRPAAGHEHGVPAFPAPLPGSHDYRAHEPAQDHAPLDVGPAGPYYAGGMAHGVPVAPVHGGRPAPAEAEQLAAQARQAAAEEAGKAPEPVPVYIVSKGAGARPMTRAAMGHKNVPAPGGDPFRLVTRDPHRRQVRLLNESTNVVRISFDPVTQPATAPGYGAMLPASMTSYLTIETQDEIWAYTEPGSTGGAQVSWISEYDIPKGG